MTSAKRIPSSRALALILCMGALGETHALAAAESPAPAREEFALQAARCRRLLKTSVVDFYLPHCVDARNGGYFEEMKEGKFVSSGSKFATLQARQMWTFSVLAREDASLRAVALEAARSGFEFIEGRMKDAEGGGYFAKVSDEGKPVDDRKHAYLNSFVLYGLAAYHRATGDPRALASAQALFRVFETRFRDAANGGYHEFFHRDWTPVVDEKETRYVGAIGTKTYNTHLHLLESFAELYREWPDPLLARRLQELILINTSTLMDPAHHCNIDGWRPDWTRVETPENLRASYGHDVECAWLVIDAADAIGMSRRPFVTWASALVAYSVEHGYDRDRGGFFYTGALGLAAQETRKEWWVQAEALVGLLTLYRETRRPEHFARFVQTLDFIEKHHISSDGGWWATLKADGSLGLNRSRTSMWQGAYHSGRALLWSAKILENLK
ncbi:MAG: AGE family epimerase/isomerase [Verrucomicrobia bacterium]|nr:AGE family epimerase/isomerase [Verrucomicrobiota bacterium]